MLAWLTDLPQPPLQDAPRSFAGSPPAKALGRIRNLDRRLYHAISTGHTPEVADALARLSVAANYSRLSLGAALVLALTHGNAGRRAAVLGLGSVAATSAVVNIVIKPIAGRQRPDRTGPRAPGGREVRMPGSRSFPSGHTAAAFAFAEGVGEVLPEQGAALELLAAAVAYSRVHTGVHYPSDVVVGAVIGKLISRVVIGRLDPTR
jgi:membrane-associated phospholipid phosphatase